MFAMEHKKNKAFFSIQKDSVYKKKHSKTFSTNFNIIVRLIVSSVRSQRKTSDIRQRHRRTSTGKTKRKSKSNFEETRFAERIRIREMSSFDFETECEAQKLRVVTAVFANTFLPKNCLKKNSLRERVSSFETK